MEISVILHMPGMLPAGPAKRRRPQLLIHFAQSFLIQKRTIISVTDDMSAADMLLQLLCKRAMSGIPGFYRLFLKLLIIFLTFLVHRYLPACTAGIRTFPGKTFEFSVIVRVSDLHVPPPHSHFYKDYSIRIKLPPYERKVLKAAIRKEFQQRFQPAFHTDTAQDPSLKVFPGLLSPSGGIL